MKFSFNILIMIFLGIRLLHAGDCLAPVFRDDVFDQMAPEMTREDIRPENMERLFKMYAPIYGGKGFWMKVLELLSQDEGAGFSVPKSDYYTVSRMWHRFFKANQSNIETANEIAS
ncbi:MAG: hypothetical protein JW774_13395, partial [Candidatus Aureabacteria bacterium]|nr:hypothetical protein [Candidatus Auribacterota bacterium]